MDPASIIGIVAAACQFAELAAKGAIKGAGLLKSLKDAPVRLTELLEVVQASKRNLAQLRGHLTEPSLSVLLPQLQVQTFQDDIDEASNIADELEQQIENLLGPGHQNVRGMKRLWRDVVSISREREFIKQFATIQRHVEQVHRGLSGVHLALSTKNL